MPKIDLHTHTTASDGVLRPRELVKKAIKEKIKVLAITDHDSISGIDEAIKAAKDKIIVIPGVELSCDEPPFIDFHVLGLDIDHENPKLVELLKKSKKGRIQQKKDMIAKLNKLGFKISFKEVSSIAKGEIGRPHIAKILLKNNPNKISSMQEVFDLYLGNGKKAFCKRKLKVSMKEAIRTIHLAGGLAFLAHPGVYKDEYAKKLVNMFIKKGGDGIETYYPYYKNMKKVTKKENTRKKSLFKKIAKIRKLLECGGTDFHGNGKIKLGEEKIPLKLIKYLL